MNTVNNEDSSRLRLLEILTDREGNIVPGAFLADKLNSSRQAVFKLIGALREEGLEIESVPQRGYRLKSLAQTDSMSPTMIDLMLRENGLFHRAIYQRQATSTQHILKKLAAQGAPEGIVSIADEQTEGRGRRGRTWQAEAGKNLLFSLLLRPKLRPGDVQLLNLAAGLAVRSAVRCHYNLQAELKWPNDILIREKKICGILSEAAGESDRIYYAVTGIGINVNSSEEDFSDDIKDTATSLMIESGSCVARPLLLVRFLNEFSVLVKLLGSNEGKKTMLSAYEEACATIGREVKIIQDDEEYIGTASGITDQGALTVSIGGENKIFAAADVHHLRMS